VAELFVLAFLGHLIGDYLLQPTWMAIGKSKKGRNGVRVCAIHVFLYTFAVMGMLLTSDRLSFSWERSDGSGLILALLIAIPHFIIDHWSLGEKWSKLIGGRTVEKTLASTGVEREFAFAFYAPVYIAVDNTWHFLCLWATIQYFIL
jgi:hypothetical protein